MRVKADVRSKFVVSFVFSQKNIFSRGVYSRKNIAATGSELEREESKKWWPTCVVSSLKIFS
jgi:hypothetical protein